MSCDGIGDAFERHTTDSQAREFQLMQQLQLYKKVRLTYLNICSFKSICNATINKPVEDGQL